MKGSRFFHREQKLTLTAGSMKGHITKLRNLLCVYVDAILYIARRKHLCLQTRRVSQTVCKLHFDTVPKCNLLRIRKQTHAEAIYYL